MGKVRPPTSSYDFEMADQQPAVDMNTLPPTELTPDQAAAQAIYGRIMEQLTARFDALSGQMIARFEANMSELAARQLASAQSVQQAAQETATARLLAEQAAAQVASATAALPAVARGITEPTSSDPFFAAKPSLKGPTFSGDSAKAAEEIHGWASRMDDHLILIGHLTTTMGPVHAAPRHHQGVFLRPEWT